MSAARALVERRGQSALTTSLIVADGCDLSHRVVIRLVRKYESDFQELGFLNFESSENRGTQGAKTEFAAPVSECSSIYHRCESAD